MAFDQSTRNRLARFVSDTRALLTEEFTRQLQHVYGLDPETGDVTDPARLTLDNVQRETARLLRETMEHYLASADTSTAAKAKETRQETLDRIVREQAFTVLNRLCALRMAEARGLLIESIAKGYQSKGFQLYQRLAGTALGETGDCYRVFLFSVFDEFAVDLPVLFDRFSPQGRLFPRETALLAVLDQINHPDIDPLWAEDETIGWIYQYFNSVEERRQMRAESQAPRNSRELAVRNQFFTPRYVVEFLTDNTLGRIWYEMTKGQTALKDSCRYLVRRPNEIFLAEGEEAPEQEQSAEDLSQEELLKQPVYIPHRPLKDPRDIKMLDPACGSMHFGLYAFDLFERIYDEAWDLEAERGPDAFVRPEGLKPLRETYDSKEAFLHDVPRLIIERNIHGIDIDPRAVQIAGLSLWLRAQKSWQAQGIKAQDRPQIQRSNIVCAEPMPGEADMLEEFLKGLREDRLESLIRRVLKVPENQKIRATPRMADALCEIVRTVWKEMELAGEAGSLLKIEESLAEAIAKGKEEWQDNLPLFRVTEFGLTEETQANPKVKYYKSVPGEEEDFWNRAEALVLTALEDYAAHAQGTDASRRRMFAHDASQGFAFIDLSRRRFDVSLMNPPFGKIPAKAERYARRVYDGYWTDVYGAFLARAQEITSGRVGAITSSLFLYTRQLRALRETWVNRQSLYALIELGSGVLDTAAVDTALTITSDRAVTRALFSDLTGSEAKGDDLLSALRRDSRQFVVYQDLATFGKLYGQPFCYHVDARKLALWKKHSTLEPAVGEVVNGNHTFDDMRFLRLRWEVPTDTIGRIWFGYEKGGDYQPFLSPTPLLYKWQNDGREARAFQIASYGTDAQVIQSISYWYRRGVTYPRVSSIGFGPRAMPEGHIFSGESISIFPHKESDLIALLGVLCSSWAQDLLYAFGRYRKIENRAVRNLPFDDELIAMAKSHLSELVSQAIRYVRDLEMGDEVSPLFLAPECIRRGSLEDALRWRKDIIAKLKHVCDQIDTAVGSYLFPKDLPSLVCEVRSSLVTRFTNRQKNGSKKSMAAKAVAYCVGAAVGRWDVQSRTEAPGEFDPFAPLPLLPPGAGVADPEVSTSETASAQPILVRDTGHEMDIVAQVRNILRLCWPDSSEALEQQCCAALGVDDLAAYFDGTFFDDHYRRHSKSRRYAPIYWPLSTPSGSYTLWLYYHRLTDQTLYTCVNDFVDPKLKQVSEEADRLRGKSHRSSAEEKELERLTDHELELKDFRDELLRVAKFWKPNLNDGVQITAAPLWKLFRHRQWKNRLKETWEKLEAGEYDWAHLALSIWPERVVRACQKDRSYAIAHDLEDQLWHEVEVEKVGRGGRVTTTTEWQPRDLSEDELNQIIAEVKAR